MFEKTNFGFCDNCICFALNYLSRKYALKQLGKESTNEYYVIVKRKKLWHCIAIRITRDNNNILCSFQKIRQKN